MHIAHVLDFVHIHREEVQRFVQKHTWRSSTLFEAAIALEDDSPLIADIDGVDDAMRLLNHVGRSEAWLARIIIAAYE